MWLTSRPEVWDEFQDKFNIPVVVEWGTLGRLLSWNVWGDSSIKTGLAHQEAQMELFIWKQRCCRRLQVTRYSTLVWHAQKGHCPNCPPTQPFQCKKGWPAIGYVDPSFWHAHMYFDRRAPYMARARQHSWRVESSFIFWMLELTLSPRRTLWTVTQRMAQPFNRLRVDAEIRKELQSSCYRPWFMTWLRCCCWGSTAPRKAMEPWWMSAGESRGLRSKTRCQKTVWFADSIWQLENSELQNHCDMVGSWSAQSGHRSMTQQCFAKGVKPDSSRFALHTICCKIDMRY